MSSERDSTDDLVVLARRRGLSEAEQRRLREVLATSLETRLLHEAGLAFDREAPVVAGDDARIERIVRQVQKGLRRPRERRSWWWYVAQGAAAGMLLAGAAGAAISITTSFFRSKTIDSSDSGTTLTAARGTPAPPRSATGAPVSSAGDDPIARKTPNLSPHGGADSPPERSVPNHAESSVGLRPSGETAGSDAPTASEDRAIPDPPASSSPSEPPAAAPPGSTASELFAAANQARVNGDTPSAIALYERLEAEFPKSTEAMTAHLSVGVLFLQQGHPARALEEFRRCRSLGMGAPEAAWGESQALRQLGRSSDERTVLEELLQKYPRSAYAPAAQKRLADLN